TCRGRPNSRRVVPANAGTHNHYCTLEGSRLPLCQYHLGRGVWVPAPDAQLRTRPGRHAWGIAQLSNMITLRSVLPAFMLAKPSLISESFSLAEIQSSRCSLPRM